MRQAILLILSIRQQLPTIRGGLTIQSAPFLAQNQNLGPAGSSWSGAAPHDSIGACPGHGGRSCCGAGAGGVWPAGSGCGAASGPTACVRGRTRAESSGPHLLQSWSTGAISFQSLLSVDQVKNKLPHQILLLSCVLL